MALYERYINGEFDQVYKEIENLGEAAFSPSNLSDIEKVLTETFQRVSYNLKVIHTELDRRNYRFFRHPLLAPLPNTEELLRQLDNSIRPFGFVPLTLKMFYRIVGACNFGWNYETHPEIPWEEAGPIQITGLKGLVEEYSDKEYLEDLAKQFQDDGFISLQVAADYLIKDNISGGPAYSIKVTNRPTIDSLFLNEENETTFINYLRICFEGCGFSRAYFLDYEGDFYQFFERVKPQLKAI